MSSTEATATTRERLLAAGRNLFWHRGFHDVGLTEILKQAAVPKGSFYHHFGSKEGFGLEVVDDFAGDSLATLERFLAEDRPAKERLRRFFESQRSLYAGNGCCDGCLLGNLGQELADSSPLFQQRIELHLREIRRRIARYLAQAEAGSDPRFDADPELLADAILSGWHGALLRMKVEKSLRPIDSFLQFHFS